MYYVSGTPGTVHIIAVAGSWRTLLRMQQRTDAMCALTTWQHFSAWNDATAAILKAILKNNPAKFHPDPIWKFETTDQADG